MLLLFSYVASLIFSNHEDEAVNYMEQAFEQRDCTLPCIQIYPLGDFMRTDPRFQPFLKRMNFPV